MPSRQSVGMPRIEREAVDDLGQPRLRLRGAMAAAEQRAGERVQRESRDAWRRGRRRNWDWPDAVRRRGDCHVRLSLTEEKRPGGGT